MNKIRNSPLVFGLFLIPYGIVKIFNFIQKGIHFSHDYYTETSRHLFLVAALLLLLGVIWSGLLKSPKLNVLPVKLVRYWWVGFTFIVLLSLGLVIYINPHARFGGAIFPPITPNARYIKRELYRRKVDATEIVILGSSRAFTLSPKYIEKKTGYSAFNMSVEGGNVFDYSVQLNFILKSNIIPRVIVVDTDPPTFSDNPLVLDLQPLTLIPYMPTTSAFSVAEKSLQDILSVQSISDSFFVLTLATRRNLKRTWTFKEDGLSVRKPLTHQQYITLLPTTIENQMAVILCSRIDSSVKEMFEAMIKLAEANNVAIVLYESPMNATFYKTAYERDPERFIACRRLIGDYLLSLSDAHPNVFFRDLSDYKMVNDLEEEGFYDAVHLRPGAAELVVDALIPEIESAMAWSLEESKK